MTRLNNRSVTFWRDENRLIRTVARYGGGTYTHSCTLAVYKDVAYAVEESKAATTLSEIADGKELPFTQVNVALEFLKDRGLIEITRRRSRAASSTLFEDAMTEFCALTDADRPRLTV